MSPEQRQQFVLWCIEENLPVAGPAMTLKVGGGES